MRAVFERYLVAAVALTRGKYEQMQVRIIYLIVTLLEISFYRLGSAESSFLCRRLSNTDHLRLSSIRILVSILKFEIQKNSNLGIIFSCYHFSQTQCVISKQNPHEITVITTKGLQMSLQTGNSISNPERHCRNLKPSTVEKK